MNFPTHHNSAQFQRNSALKRSWFITGMAATTGNSIPTSQKSQRTLCPHQIHPITHIVSPTSFARINTTPPKEPHTPTSKRQPHTPTNGCMKQTRINDTEICTINRDPYIPLHPRLGNQFICNITEVIYSIQLK